MIQKIRQFFADVALDGKRITWPSRRELVDSTIVVLVFIVLLAIIIGCCDQVIRKVLAFILG